MPPIEVIAPPPSEDKISEFVKIFNLHPIAAGTLIRRGYKTLDDAKRFLFPRLRDINDPSLLKDINEGAELFAESVIANRQIVIYGDYDVDGITSTAIIANFCRIVGRAAVAYLPHRITDGYGISADAVKTLAEKYSGALLVAVDCGSTAAEEVALARKLGFDVIVIDHHTVKETAPPANAHINPRRDDCAYPFKELAACGLTLLFVTAVRGRLKEKGYFKRREAPNLKQFLDIVALGTVADVVPLVSDNRIFVSEGIRQFARTQSPGLDALMHFAGCARNSITTYELGFKLSPRINAAGRIGNAEVALELLLCDSTQKAFELASKLNEFNERRRAEEQTIFDLASAKIKKKLSENPALKAAVIYDNEWHTGVIGIVASRLAEEYSMPVIIVGRSEQGWRGSARTIGNVDVYSILDSRRELMTEFGGHRKAAGFSIKEGSVAEFEREVEAAADKLIDARALETLIEVDGELSLSSIDYHLCSSLDRLAPFGLENPQPLFYLSDAEVVRKNITRDGRHLQLELTNGRATFDAIAFNHSDKIDGVDKATLVGLPRIENYLGDERIKIVIKHIKTASK
ncbi:MAG: single-stranded-DNA-specific exonuclease RecJ [Myxococcota bacterium]